MAAVATGLAIDNTITAVTAAEAACTAAVAACTAVVVRTIKTEAVVAVAVARAG